MPQKKNKLKHPSFRILCFMLVLNLMLAGVTFARYSSTKDPDPTLGVAPFTCSIDIGTSDGAGFIFNNANYEHEGLIMNSPQLTDFSIKNYRTENAVTTVAGVNISYSIVFYVPKLFARSAAVQITKSALDGTASAVTPLYVLNDFITKASFNTSDSFTVSEDHVIADKYQSVGDLVQTFTSADRVTETVGGKEFLTSGTFTDSANGANVVKIETVTCQSKLVRSFPCFSDQNKMLARIYLTDVEDVEYYKFTVSNTSLSVLTANEQTEYKYQLRLVPTKGMSQQDDVIDVDFNKPWSDYYSALNPSADSISSASGWTVACDASGKIDLTFNGTTYGNVTVKECDGKAYPCRLNALFVQASTAV